MSGYGFREIGEFGLSTEKILAKKPDSILWRHYLGRDYTLGRSIPAPYRPDKSPSFCLKYDPKSGKIIGKDYGKGGFHGDVFDYVQMLYNLDFYSALVRVNLDFDLGLKYSLDRYNPQGDWRPVTKKEVEVLDKFQASYDEKEIVIQFQPRHFTSGDGAYWTQYGIRGTTLLKYRVYAVDRVWLNKTTIYWHKVSDPCYIYFFPQTDYRPSDHAKCYWPLSTRRRFLGNCSNERDIQGYDQCSIAKHKHSDLLVLTKSMKDCMVLHELGVEAMATHGEAHKLSADFVRHLKKYYGRIVSLYDRDETGMKGAQVLWREYGIQPYFINKKYMCKDVSDMFKAHGREVTNTFIQTIKRK
jgi:hypothetical protein